MTERQEHHVALRLVQGYEFVATFDGAGGTERITFDEPPPLGGGAGPSASAMFAAAVGDCLAASFAYCLRKVRLEPLRLHANVVARVERNEQGRYRITGVDVELVPELQQPDAARQERCERLFEDFCVVTESVRRGIPVEVRIAAPAEVRASERKP